MRPNIFALCRVSVLLLTLMPAALRAQDSLGMERVAVNQYWRMLNDIQIVGELAYFVAEGSGLHIVNVADPANPVELSCVTWGSPYGIYVDGDLVYAVGGNFGIVVNVADPASPQLISSWYSEAEMEDIFVHGTMAVVKIFDTNPDLYDVSDATWVQRLGTFPAGYAVDLPGMVGEYFCVTSNLGGIQLWDLSDPANPQRVSAADTTQNVRATAISGNYAYLATMGAGVRIVDLTHPLRPEEVAVCDSGECLDISVSGDYALVARGPGLGVWNISDPLHPHPSGRYQSADNFDIVAYSGSQALAGCLNSDSLLTVLDMSDPYNPAVASAQGHAAHLGGLGVAGDYLVAADGGTGWRVFSLADEAQPVEVARGPGGSGKDLTIAGQYAYVVCGYNGLRTVDFSDPLHPQQVASMALSDDNIKAVVHHGYLYVLAQSFGGQSELYALNLADPAHPVLEGTCMLEAGMEDIAFRGDYAYATGGSSRLVIIGLEDPGHPVIIRYDGYHIWSDFIAISGDYAYVTLQGSGIQIMSLADPQFPDSLSLIEFGSSRAYRQTVIGQYLYSSWYRDCIRIFDISDPASPVSIGYNCNGQVPLGMDTRNNYLYATSTYTVTTYDCAGAYANSSAPPARATVKGFALQPAFPNPFNPSTQLRFTLERTENVKLTVFDITGREVQRLDAGMLAAGEHELRFDGSALATGLYFARLEAGGKAQTQKLMLVK
jgi:hypothetical protein